MAGRKPERVYRCSNPDCNQIIGYMSGNKDGYRLRCKTDLVKKYPELFRDVWQYDVDEVTYKQEDKR